MSGNIQECQVTVDKPIWLGRRLCLGQLGQRVTAEYVGITQLAVRVINIGKDYPLAWCLCSCLFVWMSGTQAR